MNGYGINLWKFNPEAQVTAKVFFPLRHIQSAWAWSHRYSMRIELQGAML